MSDAPNTPPDDQSPTGRGDSVLAGLPGVGSVSDRNETRRTLRLISRGLDKGAVKVWRLSSTLPETLGMTIERVMDAAEGAGDAKTTLLAADVLRKLNADNARHLANADRLELMSEALELKLGRRGGTTPGTKVIELHGNVTVGVMVQAPTAPPPPPPPPPPALGSGGSKIDLG